jgi:hypothetical protein
MNYRLRMLVQVLGSAAVLAFVPGNVLKAIVFPAWWLLTFRRPTLRELGLYVAAGVLFTVLDYLTLRQGIFRFNHPDFLLMPCYEPLLWGYLLLHTVHMVDGPAPGGRWPVALAMAVAFALPFLLLTDQALLFYASAAVLAVGLIVYHEPYDLAYAGYLALVGVLWEHVGVWFDQWSYPETPPTGVPPWFATMFAGIGLMLRRLVLPFLVGPGRRTGPENQVPPGRRDLPRAPDAPARPAGGESPEPR